MLLLSSLDTGRFVELPRGFRVTPRKNGSSDDYPTKMDSKRLRLGAAAASERHRSRSGVLEEWLLKINRLRNKNALRQAHGAVTVALSHSITTEDPARFLKARQVPALDIPITHCGEQYKWQSFPAILGDCLPFARRGALMVVGDGRATEAEQRGQLEWGAALGAAGFLVLFRGGQDWTLLQEQQEAVFVRRGPNLFVMRREMDAGDFLGGGMTPTDPVGVPVLFLGDPATRKGAEANLEALAYTGSPVLVLVAEDGTARRKAFLASALCSPGVALALVQDDDVLEMIDGLPAHCGCPLMLLDDKAAGLTDVDAAAATVAALLADPLDNNPYIHNRLHKQQQQQHQGGRGGKQQRQQSRRHKSGSARTTGATPRPVVSLELAADGPVPSRSAAHCPDKVPYVLPSFLLRCLPGRRAAYMQSATIPWDSKLYQRPQHMCTAMDKLNVLVIYVQFARPFGAFTRVSGKPNVFMVDAEFRFITIFRGLIINIYSTNLGVTPGWLTQTQVDGNAVVYEYIDAIDEAITGDTVAALEALRKEAVEQAVLVTYTARALRKDVVGGEAGGVAARPEESVVFVPNGVDPSMYTFAHPPPTPHSIQHIVNTGKPIVGYFGAIAPWIWVEAITDIARNMPEAEFLLIGPEYPPAKVPEPASLPPNLHYHEPVAAADLVKFAQHFTVGFIPFRSGNIAKTTSPLKLFEYFAMGLPSVVTRDMDECTQFKHVRAAASVDEYVQQLRAAIKDADDVGIREEILQLAQQNSWDVRAATTIEALTNALQHRRKTY